MKVINLPAILIALLSLSTLLRAQVLMRDFIGVNVKPQLDYSRMARFGQAQAFHIWSEDQGNVVQSQTLCPLETSNDPSIPKIRWNPSRNTNRYIRFDEFYRILPRKTLAVLHGSSPHMYANSGELFAKPLCPDYQQALDLQDDPEAWLSHAKRASLFAARYAAPPAGGFHAGFATIAGSYIESPDHAGLGLRLVGHIEISNETDAAWADGLNTAVLGYDLDLDPGSPTKYYFRPREYGALLSAAYDGDENSPDFEIKNSQNEVVGHWGIKNLSSGATMVLAGTADMRYDYLYLLKKYWDETRGQGNYPFDVVNYHFYSTTLHPSIDGGQYWNEIYHGRNFFGGGNGVYPESSNINLRGRIEKLLSDRIKPANGVSPALAETGTLFPDKPSWITEFGYDTEGPGGIKIIPFSDYDAQTIQGQWITRYFMEASAAREGNSVQKVFMYELNDDPSVGGQFHHSGLLAKEGTPKKSWYHLMTLKSVLDWSAFTKRNKDLEIAFLDNGIIKPVDDPRMYHYGGEKKPTYAIWVPHGADVRYDGAILLKTENFGSGKPQLQAIEVVEYDEDGKRTEIHPDLIEPYTSADGKLYWKVNGIRQGDTHISLTETPLYLRVNQNRMASDRIVPPVKDLAATCGGCSDVKLTWLKQGNYSYYNIYLQKLNCADPGPAVFDPINLTLVGERVSGYFAEALVSDLQENACYRFWVVPFMNNWNGVVGNAGVSPLFTYSPTDMSIPVLNKHYVDYTVGNCTPCVQPFMQNQISLDYDPGLSPGYELPEFYKMLIPEAGADLCNEFEFTPTNYGVNLGSGKNKVVFTLDLQGAKYADAIYFYYQTGSGRVRFEVLENCCIRYSQVATIDIHDGATQPNTWYRIFNTPLNYKNIEKIRVTIECLPEVGLNIRRMFFCLRPAPDACPEDGMKEIEVVPVTNITVEDIDQYAATLQWAAARLFEEEQELPPVQAYRVRYGIALDATGKIVQPVEFTYETPAWGGENNLPLSPLVPNTTYFVDIEPDIDFYPCIPVIDHDSPFSFTTLPETQERQKTGEALVKKPDLSLSPNPTEGLLQVSGLDKRFSRFRICYANGIAVYDGALAFEQETVSIQLPELPNGLYVVTFLGEQVLPASKAFLLNRP